jgi:hypothetical protein
MLFRERPPSLGEDKGGTVKKLIVCVIVALSALLPIAMASAASNPYGTTTVDPAAPNEVILTISKGDRSAEFSYSRLLKMKQSTITIYEPFLKKRQSFTVVQLKSLFNFAGISGDDKVITTALNDYIFTAKASQFVSAGAYIAIKRNGSAIGYDQGGPIRIVFADDSKWAKNLDAWNWSLERIRVN